MPMTSALQDVVYAYREHPHNRQNTYETAHSHWGKLFTSCCVPLHINFYKGIHENAQGQGKKTLSALLEDSLEDSRKLEDTPYHVYVQGSGTGRDFAIKYHESNANGSKCSKTLTVRRQKHHRA